MAIAIRPAPDVLTPVEALPRHPAGALLVDALRSAIAQRKEIASEAPRRWTLAEALAALDPQQLDIELFAALRLLQGVQPGKGALGYSQLAEQDPVRIDQQLLLAFAPAEVSEVAEERGAATSRRPTVRQAAVGLLGPNGALPYAWTEFANELEHSAFRSARDDSLHALINLLQRRQLAFLYRAWSDTSAVAGMDRAGTPHPLVDRLRALAGLALGDMDRRGPIAPSFKLAFAGVLSQRVRSPQALAAMLSHHFGVPVRIEEFVAHWLEIPTGQRTRLGVQFTTLGEDAVAGARVWDCSTRFRIFVGPLTLEQYRAFLPRADWHTQLGELVALYAGAEYDWELVPVLRRSEVPFSWLGNQGLRLGWSSWLGVRFSKDDAADLRLRMEPQLALRSDATQSTLPADH